MKLVKKDIIIFILIFVIAIIEYNGFLTMHYATDTYNIINRGYSEYAIKYSLNDGRPMMCLISLLADLLNVPITLYIILLTFFAIITSCICVVFLKKIISKYKEPINIWNEIILTIICYVTIFNFMYLENLQFAECFVMSMSLLIYITAAYILVQEKNKYILKSILLSIFGIMFYQGTLSVFVVMTVLFSIIKDNSIILTLKKFLLAGIACIIAVIFNLVQIKLCGLFLNMEQVRMGSIKNIIVMLPIIFKSLPKIIFYTCNIFPTGLFLGFILSILIIYNNVDKKIKSKINNKIIIILLISIILPFAPNLFTQSSFGAARMMFPIGSLIGNIFILLYTKTSIFENNNVSTKIFEFILIIYMLLNIMTSMYIIYCHKKIEKLNKEECNIINSFITKYEQNNNIKIKKIAICHDKNPTFFYNIINNYSSLCYRPLALEWSDDGSINYYTGRNLEEIDTTIEIYNQYFKDKDWDKLSEEQFVFIEDTVYYCIY